MSKSTEDLTQKELTALLQNKSMNIRSRLFEIAGKLEEVIYDWDKVSYSVGTADQYKAEEAVDAMLIKLTKILEDIEKCRRSF